MDVPEAPIAWKTFYRQLGLHTLLTHTAGALASFLYFTMIDPVPAGEKYFNSLGVLDFVIFGAVTAGLFAISYFMGIESRQVEKYMQHYYSLRQRDITCEVPEKVLSGILNYPLLTARQGLAIWVLAGLIFAVPNYSTPADMLRGFLGIVGVGGILTTAVIFFVTELDFQKLYPYFFPDGRLSATPGILRLTVPLRLLLVSLLSTLYPVFLLAQVSLSRAQQIAHSPNPQVLVDNLMLAELFIVVAAIILASSFASFIARMIVRPLRMLQEGMLQVSKNDLKARVSILSPDELGTLADGFNDMVAGLNQRETLRNLLNHYVSPEVAKMALDSGALLGGQLVQCTILFSDLRNFTGISEKLAPQEMIQLLNRYMSLMVDVIVANGGIVTRFGGDSILAVFGTPLNPHSDHPLRAVRAALEMQRSLVDFNHSLAGSGMAPLVAGIGIATGEVVAGNVGGQQRMEYTVIGDPANLAARLQTMTKELGCSILLHGETYHAARRSLPLEAKAIPPLAVRGKSVPVEAFILQ